MPLTVRLTDLFNFFFQAEDGIRDVAVTGVQTCALPISIFCFERKNLVKDAEYLIGIDGTKSEVIVGIATVVEMKPAYHLVMEQPGDDLLDVLCLVVMSRIHQHIGLRTGSLGQQQGHAPVRDVSVIERRLEGLVFDQKPLARPEGRMHFLQSLFKIADSLSNALSPGIIRSVRKPGRDVAAIERFRDSNAIENVV